MSDTLDPRNPRDSLDSLGVRATQRQMDELNTLRRLVAESERYMTPAERADWRARVTRHLARNKEFDNE